MQNNRKKTAAQSLKMSFAAVAVASLAACTSISTHNIDVFKNEADYTSRVASVSKGMPMDQVLSILNFPRGRLVALDRTEMMTALYGENANLRGSLKELEEASRYFDTLSVYKLQYRNVKTEESLSMKAAWNTDREGYDHTLVLVFDKKTGVLLNDPINSGGYVNGNDSDALIPKAIRSVLRKGTDSIVP